MMKTLFVTIILSLLSFNSFAIDFTEKDEPQAKSLKEAVKTFVILGKMSSYDIAGPAHPEVMSFNSNRTDYDKLIRHYIWRTNTGWSTPSDVTTVSVARTEQEYRSAAAEAINYLDDVDSEKLEKEFIDQVAMLLKYKTLKLYSLGHGNTFGGCYGVVVVDSYYKEFVILQSCYAE